MNKHKITFILPFLFLLLIFNNSCKNSLIVKKRQHQKGYYISWSGKELKHNSAENPTKESIQKEINNIDEIFANVEDSVSNYIAQVEAKQNEISKPKNEASKYKNDFSFYDILNQNTKAYTSNFSIDDLKSLRDEIKEAQNDKTLGDGLEIIIYFSLWISIMTVMFFVEPIIAWVMLGILVVVLILIIWAIIALGKALRDARSHCHQACRPPSGCH